MFELDFGKPFPLTSQSTKPDRISVFARGNFLQHRHCCPKGLAFQFTKIENRDRFYSAKGIAMEEDELGLNHMKRSHRSKDKVQSMYMRQENEPSVVASFPLLIEHKEHLKRSCAGRRNYAEDKSRNNRWFAACAMAYQYVQGCGVFNLDPDVHLWIDQPLPITHHRHQQKEIHRQQPAVNEICEDLFYGMEAISRKICETTNADVSVCSFDSLPTILQKGKLFYTMDKSSGYHQQKEKHRNRGGSSPPSSTALSDSRNYYESHSSSIHSMTDIISIEDIVNPTQAPELFGPHILASSILAS
ncbi:hypothetical protein KP509_24G070500 [Ceratopteris richardii]|uniref:Uncharacterized protein n=1 Tax=Ceratopteris richardii TaxID=49495 RepID=A0A8T2RVK5_CERRI|nr:hypothetical protein KP509_24G070500 [Ceratopteris richardii]